MDGGAGVVDGHNLDVFTAESDSQDIAAYTISYLQSRTGGSVSTYASEPVDADPAGRGGRVAHGEVVDRGSHLLGVSSISEYDISEYWYEYAWLS